MNRKKWALLLAAVMVFGLLTACGSSAASSQSDLPGDTLQLVEDSGDALQLVEDTPTAAPAEPAVTVEPEIPAEPEISEAPEDTTEPEISEAPEVQERQVQETPAPSREPEALDEDGEYTTPEDVALYLHTYGHLPGNFITKNKARDLGWDSSRGNLWDVAPGKSIGGDRFGNYEGLLPEDTKYRECDVNYAGGYRGAERLIYGEDGSIYYTNDHYNSFTQLY